MELSTAGRHEGGSWFCCQIWSFNDFADLRANLKPGYPDLQVEASVVFKLLHEPHTIATIKITYISGKKTHKI